MFRIVLHQRTKEVTEGNIIENKHKPKHISVQYGSCWEKSIRVKKKHVNPKYGANMACNVSNVKLVYSLYNWVN